MHASPSSADRLPIPRLRSAFEGRVITPDDAGYDHARTVFDGGVVLDLSALKALDLDPDRRTAWAQTGLTAGQYTVAAAAHGLATGASRRTARNQRIVRIAEADVADELHRRYCHHPPVGTTRQPLGDRP